ncbi:MAG: BrnA antitoxin family protein [Pseudomonadota bacterium]|nr:BrnA antitoxin family protein [Pseudomonadota bacterium]MDE3037390.1 BrnA antitoxin family protein [Pseudomonadota bacterium]
MKKRYLTTKDGDVRELTREDIRGMRPLRETDPEFIAKFEKERKRRGRPAGRTKAVVSISLDRDILSLLRASGSGWQSRINALLRAAMGLSE